METSQQLLDRGIDLYLQDGKMIDDDLAAGVDQIIIEEELSSAGAQVWPRTDDKGVTWQEVQFGDVTEGADGQKVIINLGAGDLVPMVQLMIDLAEKRLTKGRSTSFKYVLSASNPRFVISGMNEDIKQILREFPGHSLWRAIERNRLQRSDVAEISKPQIVLQNP